ncbi:MAG: hypothetical protein RIS44_301 [Pseudomonadota bacterium]|jgi:hypothetical protein
MDMPATAPDTVVVQAQRQHQQWALALGSFCLVLMFLGYLWGQPWLTAWLTDSAASADERALRTAWFVIGVISLLGLTGLITAAWLATMAWRIRKANCFPPPGYPVLRATRRLNGPPAQKQALWHGLAAVASLLLCAGVLAYLFHTFPLAETLYMLRS